MNWKSIRRREAKLFDRMREASSHRTLRSAQFEYAKSFAAKAVAALRSASSGRLGQEVSEQEIQRFASELNIWRPCSEHVMELQVPKGNGHYRPITIFGPKRYAMDYMAHRMLQARFNPHPAQYGVKGRGRDQACDAIARAITQEGRRFAVLLDIRDAFGSVDLEALDRLPIPPLLLRNIFPGLHQPHHLHHTSFGLQHTGLPQGAAASSLALAIILQPMLEQMPGTARSILYSDDFCGLCDSQTAAAEIENALLQALEILPGAFSPKLLCVREVDEGFDFLGYRFTLEKNEVTVSVARSSFTRFLSKCASRAVPGATTLELQDYCRRWGKSFPLAYDHALSVAAGADGYSSIKVGVICEMPAGLEFIVMYPDQFELLRSVLQKAKKESGFKNDANALELILIAYGANATPSLDKVIRRLLLELGKEKYETLGQELFSGVEMNGQPTSNLGS